MAKAMREMLVKFERTTTQTDALGELLPGLGVIYRRNNNVLVHVRADAEQESGDQTRHSNGLGQANRTTSM